MPVPFTKPMAHRQVEHTQGTMFRGGMSEPYFMPPVPTQMIDPVDNFFTIITAEGPHTTEYPGLRGGTRVNANNWPQDKQPPLTRKGG